MRYRLNAITAMTRPLAAVALCAALPFAARMSVPARATPVAEAFDVGMMHVERFGTRGRQS